MALMLVGSYLHATALMRQTQLVTQHISILPGNSRSEALFVLASGPNLLHLWHTWQQARRRSKFG